MTGTPPGIDRKQFLHGAGLAGAAALVGGIVPGVADGATPSPARPAGKKAPRAITMWDFSWLERRWPGAGYEDWDRALDELSERGYNAVRIDAYPHLIVQGPTAEWTLKPEWDTQVWGSPALNRVTVLPALYEFLGKCRDRDIKVSLSCWFRQDLANTRLTVSGPDRLAEIWVTTLDGIRKAGLLDTIMFVDLCNEWPGPAWAPFLQPPLNWGEWHVPRSVAYMKQAIAGVRKAYPDMPLTFSTDSDRVEIYAETNLDYFDLVEHHEWMVRANDNEFYNRTGYKYERFSPVGYDNLQLTAEKIYREKPDYWKKLLVAKIDRIAAASRRARKPFITTECWAIVDYKDWPLLPWDWVKDVCEVGALRASASGQWAAIATSNFCGPQFAGMWRDVAWHKRITSAIRAGELHESICDTRLYARL